MSTDDDEYAELLAALQASGTANAPRDGGGIHMSICDKAASAIKRLISERDEAREALRPFAAIPSGVSQIEIIVRWGADRTLPRSFNLELDDLRRARAARSPKPAKSEGE